MKGHHIQINKFKFKNLNFRLTMIIEECDNFDHYFFVNNYFFFINYIPHSVGSISEACYFLIGGKLCQNMG